MVLTSIEVLRDEVKQKSLFTIFVSTGVSLAIALISLFGALKSVRVKERGDESRAVRQVSLQAMNQLMAWRLKQTELLYGPLHALMTQSHEVYQQFLTYLVTHRNTNGNCYRWIEDSESTCGKSLQVFEGGDWQQFRLIDQLPSVYDSDTNAGPLVDEVMSVGDRMVEVIRDHAGLGLTSQPQLQSLFGKYLAHFALLQQMYKAVRKQGASAAELRGRYEESHFPRKLQSVIAAGLEEISKEIRGLEEKLATFAYDANAVAVPAGG